MLGHLLFPQVAEPVPPGRKMVRQLMHVNGVEADELTLAEVGSCYPERHDCAVDVGGGGEYEARTISSSRRSVWENW